MKTEELEKLLENAEIDTKAKIAEIFKMNGIDVNAERTKYADLTAEYQKLKDASEQAQTKYATYDADMAELAEFRKTKAEKEFTDRFSSMLKERKPLNEFTEKGLSDLFKTEIEKGDGRTDEQIFTALIEGKESSYFAPSETKPTITIQKASDVPIPTETKAYLDDKYASSPFYNKN